jgi:heme-degrading monooxygenase HmoA
MAYIFMAIHYPEPGRRDDLHHRMTKMAESLSGAPGLIEIGAWLEFGGERVVGVSRWHSRAAFEAAMPGSGVPNDVIHEWERRPREYFHLAQPGA